MMRLFAAAILGFAGLLTAGLLVPVFLIPPAQGYDGMGEFLLMLAGASLRWTLLAVLLGLCVVKGRFNWVPGGSTAGRFAIVLGVHLVLGGLSVTAMLTLADSSMLRGLPPGLIRPMHLAAQAGGTLPAIATIACLVAVNWFDPARAPAIPLLGAAAGGLAGLLVVGALVGQDIGYQRARAAEATHAALVRAADIRQEFATLTDADPLLRWDEFVHAELATEALRRLSVRPGLERDLADALGCDCRNPNWTGELLWLIGAIPFEPSADLAGPAEQAIDTLAAHVRVAAAGAYSDQRDTYVDLYLARELETVRVVAAKFARSAGSDLRPALRNMRSAVVETYPRSEAARRYPAEVDLTAGEIAAILHARRD